MPRGDAVQSRPTIEQEMAKFKGFSTTDGEVSKGEPTEDEKRVLAANSTKVADGAAAAATADAAAQAAASEAAQAITAAAAEGAEEAEEEAPEGETAEDKAAREAAAAAKPKPKKSAQERINQAVKKQREVERQLDTERGAREALERRLAALEARGDGRALTQQATATTTDGSVAPDPKDFEYGELDTKYIRALARYETKQELAADRLNQQKTQQTTAQARDAAEMQAQAAAFEEAGAKKYDDFHEVVIEGARSKAWPLSETLGRLMLASPEGYDVAYHLASNPKEAREIYGKSPVEQAAAFGRLAAKLSSTSSDATGKVVPIPAKTTQAPTPLKGARGSGATTSVSADTTDFASFERLAMGRAK